MLSACGLLGSGETATILAAKSICATLVLLDERKARRIAKNAGLSVIGCIGVLEIACKREFVSDLRAVYIDLLREAIRFDLKLLQDSLRRLRQPPL